MSIPESKEIMVGCQSYAKWCAEDEGSVVDLLDDEVQPGEELLVIHLDEVGTCDGLADSVLDDYDYRFNSTNSFMVFR